MKKILLVLLSLAMLFACDLGSDSSKKDDEKKVTEPEGTTPEVISPEETTPEVIIPEVTIPEVVMSRGILKDSNNVVIGNVLTANTHYLEMMSPEGYMYYLNWDGSMDEKSVYFSEENCQGIPFVRNEETPRALYAKRLFQSNGKYYMYKDRGDGLSVSNAALSTYKSRYTAHNQTVETFGTPQTFQWNDASYELVVVTKAQCGIPENIVAPLNIVYDTPVVAPSRNIVEDSDGNVIGELIDIADGMRILTSTGYIIFMDFNGNYTARGVKYFTGDDGAGEKYVDFDPLYHYYKEVWEYQGEYYLISEFDSTGKAIPDSTVVIESRYQSWNDTFDNVGPFPNNGQFYKVAKVDTAVLGLASSVKLPIVIKNNN